MSCNLFIKSTSHGGDYRLGWYRDNDRLRTPNPLANLMFFYILPAIRFHILTPFLVGKLVVLPPFRGAILPFEKNAEDFRIFFKKFFEQQNTPVRKARTDV